MNLASIDPALARELLLRYEGSGEGSFFGGDVKALDTIFDAGRTYAWGADARIREGGSEAERLRILLDQAEFIGEILDRLCPPPARARGRDALRPLLPAHRNGAPGRPG